MNELTFLKLGGSILTDKNRPEALDEAALEHVTRTIVSATRATGLSRLLIGHGAGSFGHYWANHYQTQQGVYDARGWEGVVRIADSMRRLNIEVVRRLLDGGCQAVAIQPSASAIAEGGQLVAMAVEPLRALLDAGIVPVVHGDVVVDRHKGATIISTEALFVFLAQQLAPRRVILVGEDAVYTGNPRLDPEARRIPIIDGDNIADVLRLAGGSHGVDVTGGMATKLAAMWQLVSATDNLEVRLVGTDTNAIDEALRGKPATFGTVIRN